MKNFRIKYIIQTKSRYGAYNYSCTDTFLATTQEEAIKICKEQAGTKISFKRFKVIIKKVEEI